MKLVKYANMLDKEEKPEEEAPAEEPEAVPEEHEAEPETPEEEPEPEEEEQKEEEPEKKAEYVVPEGLKALLDEAAKLG